MKYIVLSFDDGRKDFYNNALAILKKYNLTATLNIITDYVGDVKSHSGFDSGNNEFVNLDEIHDCIDNNIEIANHSSDHSNNIEKIKKGSKSLKSITGLNKIGFASPHSNIWEGNSQDYFNLLKDGDLEYIRSGNQVKRDGFFSALLYLMSKFTKLKKIFYLYNKKNLINMNIKNNDLYKWIYPSITCNRDNSVDQLIYFIESMPKDHAVIIMFHSILKEDDPGYGKDRWYNSVEEFDEICKFLYKEKDIKVLTNQELHNIIF